jgi:hypothetical protein
MTHLIPTLNWFFNFVYNEDQALREFTFDASYQEHIESIFDILPFSPKHESIDEIFTDNLEGVRRIKLEDLPADQKDCTVCMNSYDETEIKPAQLTPCGHIMCDKCSKIVSG